jgi:toxin ParE1/3/4
LPRNRKDETLMPRLLKRPEAESDLDEIWWYIAQDSPHNADRFLDRIQERCLGLTDFPQMGTRRDELKAGLRSQPVGNYLIFYFPLEDGIDIVRVLHGSRDVDAIFHPDD